MSKDNKNMELTNPTDLDKKELIFDSVTTMPIEIKKHVEHVRVTKPFSEFQKEKEDEKFIKNFEFKEENVKKAKSYIKALNNLLEHKNVLGEKTTTAIKKNRRHLIKAIKTKDGVKLKEGMFEYLSLLASIYSILKGVEDESK